MVVIEENTMDFSKIENCLWLVIITMTTVGYGDYYAKTLFGRIWTILCAIWGIFVVSCLVVVLTNMLQCINIYFNNVFIFINNNNN